jgi:membrane peptidoglycan carboxypeptidase
MLAMRFDLDEVAKLPAGTTFYDRKGVEIIVPGSLRPQVGATRGHPGLPGEIPPCARGRPVFRASRRGFRGLARATVRNIKDRDFTQGASTLSMQLARNSFEDPPKSLHRKFLEIALTLRIESRYSKDEILTHYLNRIYFGAGAYGIEQAARTYFGKTTRDLTTRVRAARRHHPRPAPFSPLRKPEAALEQRRQTLDRMVTMGFITKERRDAIAGARSSSRPMTRTAAKPPTPSKRSSASSTASSTTTSFHPAACIIHTTLD